MLEPQNEESCAKKNYVIHEKDLPLSCPMESMPLWNAHPRVFLPIKETGKAVCPYCGACYVLEA